MKYLLIPMMVFSATVGCTSTISNVNSSEAVKNPAPTATSANSNALVHVDSRRGDLKMHGGTATVRDAYNKEPGKHTQPFGHMGTMSLYVTNEGSGNSYPLDADVESNGDEPELHRLYFPKGGWVDFANCELDQEYSGECTDENGRLWQINGED